MIDVVAPSCRGWSAGRGWLCYHVNRRDVQAYLDSRMFRKVVNDVKSCHPSLSLLVSIIIVRRHCHWSMSSRC